MARLAYGVAGAVIGYVATGFNPAGAYWGFTIGYGIGSYLNPTQISAPGLSEAPTQTSRDGVPITIVWGLHGGISGNIIQKNPEVITTTTESTGKGGGSEVETQHRFRTFAIGVCEGPIDEVTRIWENGKLVYDVRDTPGIPIAETLKYAEGITIYLGTEDQLPDPELEAHWGVDDTPAYRGLAYIVWVNKELTDFGGAIPQFEFEVNGSRDLSITSEPYPVDAVEGLVPQITFPEGWVVQWPIEAIETESLPLEGDYGGGLKTYTWTEAIETESWPQEGDYGATLESYTWEEAIETESWPVEGDYGDTLVSYSWEEAIETTCTPEGGTYS